MSDEPTGRGGRSTKPLDHLRFFTSSNTAARLAHLPRRRQKPINARPAAKEGIEGSGGEGECLEVRPMDEGQDRVKQTRLRERLPAWRRHDGSRHG